jgi:uncharacterized protein (DUF1778 family)
MPQARTPFTKTACGQAENLLLDQTYFALDADCFAALQALLDKPPTPTDRLRRTLNASAPWLAQASLDGEAFAASAPTLT